MGEQAKHTPGPWHLHPSGRPCVLDTYTVFHGHGETAANQLCSMRFKADAMLIAAAPDMLVELRKVEWSATVDNQSARDPAGAACCPACFGLSPAYPWPTRFPRVTVGHAADCTLAAVLAKVAMG